jgi:hypothetical protein
MATSNVYRYDYPLGTVSGGQDIVTLNHLQNPFLVAVLVDIVSGAAQYGIEFTFDDTGDGVTNIRWFPLPAAPAGTTISYVYTLTSPVTAIRLNLGAISGEVRFTVIQSHASTR